MNMPASTMCSKSTRSAAKHDFVGKQPELPGKAGVVVCVTGVVEHFLVLDDID